ncbi:hypothetical protein BT69DRAFT_1351959 [Atractiella rhizophila]|nr:hypothetical protein BT69DRAFT_1351959 [Atractiella rhizophila]
MEETTQHHLNEPHSAVNPIPSTNTADSTTATTTPSAPTGTTNGEVRKDPITGGDVALKSFADADVKTTIEKSKEGRANLLFYKFPPPDWSLFKTRTNALISQYLAFVFVSSSLLRLVSKGYFSSFLQLALIAGGGYYVQQQVARLDAEVMFGGSEVQRGEMALRDEVPESTEWLNAFLGTLWPIINSDMFAGSADMIEDIMQQSLPKFIKMVKVASIHQGTRGVRILHMKTLKDSEFSDIEKEREKKLAEEEKNSLQAIGREKAASERAEERAGKYVNLELTLAHHASPTKNPKRPQNPSIQLQFYIGAIGQTINLPIWAEILELLVTVRLRLQLTPDPPFLKNLTFSFSSLPKVGVSVLPMSRSLPNVVDLPVIKGLVQSSVEVAMKEFMVPKSMTLDVGEILSGDGIKKKLDTWGVVFIRLHSASNLHPHDQAGKSDPYFLLSFSKFGKPLYSTRVIEKTLNPRYEETAALLIRTDEVKADESVRAELWDSDRFSDDDKVGKCEVSLRQLIKQKGETISLSSPIESYKGNGDKGTLHWDLAFYDIRALNEKLRTDGADPRIPQDLKDKNPELKELQAQEKDVLCTPPDPEYPSGVISVIVHQIVDLGRHKARNTYKQRKKMSVGAEEQAEGILVGVSRAVVVGFRDADAGLMGQEEEGDDAPSSYCKLYLNDEAIYKTRVKAYTANPFFNAGTEKFLPDWRSAKFAVAVLEKEEDSDEKLMGTVQLNIGEALKNASCVSNFYSIADGVGYGKIKISILFRSIDTQLPKNLLNFNLGTLELLNDVEITSPDAAALNALKLKLKVWDYAKSFEPSKDGGAVWATKGLHLPVTKRNSAIFWVTFKKKSKLAGFNKHVYAVANKRLADIVDDQPTDLELEVVLPKSGNNAEGDSAGSSSESVGLPPAVDISLEQRLILCLMDRRKILMRIWGDKEVIGKIKVSVIFRRGRTTAHSDDKQATRALTDTSTGSDDDKNVAGKKKGFFGKLKSKAMPKLDGQGPGVESEA